MSDTTRTASMGDDKQEVEPVPEVAIETPPTEVAETSESPTVDVPAPDEQMWPGGPIFAQVEEWKAKYNSVYVTAITEDKFVVWRTINRTEYRNIVKTLEQAVNEGEITQAEANLNNEEMIALTCMLYPTYDRASISDDMAGIASIISQEVLEASAFTALEIRKL